jgi:hypothetical protein
MRKTSEFLQPVENIKIDRVAMPGSDAMSKRYQLQRERTGQDFNAQQDKSADAIKRKFASLGSSGSGAQLKIQEQSMAESQAQKQQAMEGIDTNQAAEQEQRDMQQGQMDQQMNLAQADMNFKNKVFSFEKGSKMHELDLAERSAQQDAATTEFNKRMSEYESRPKTKGLIGSLVGDLF